MRYEDLELPDHWGSPPSMVTYDSLLLPKEFGLGENKWVSGTIYKWIVANIKKDQSIEK